MTQEQTLDIHTKTYTSRIAKGAKVTGDVHAREGLLINGEVEGSVHSSVDVKIGKDGTVRGDVEARHLVVEGSIYGKVDCSEWLVVTKTGRINGDVATVHFKNDDGMIRGTISQHVDKVEEPPAQRQVGGRNQG